MGYRNLNVLMTKARKFFWPLPFSRHPHAFSMPRSRTTYRGMQQHRFPHLANDTSKSLVDFLMELPETHSRPQKRDAEAVRLEAMLARQMRTHIVSRLRHEGDAA
jgi:hypothetical protein